MNPEFSCLHALQLKFLLTVFRLFKVILSMLSSHSQNISSATFSASISIELKVRQIFQMVPTDSTSTACNCLHID